MDKKKQELLIDLVKENFRDEVLDTVVFRGEATS